MNHVKAMASRSVLLFAVVAFGFTVAVPALGSSPAATAATFNQRKITLSSSADGNTSTDANGNTFAGDPAVTVPRRSIPSTSISDLPVLSIQYCCNTVRRPS